MIHPLQDLHHVYYAPRNNRPHFLRSISIILAVPQSKTCPLLATRPTPASRLVPTDSPCWPKQTYARAFTSFPDTFHWTPVAIKAVDAVQFFICYQRVLQWHQSGADMPCLDKRRCFRCSLYIRDCNAVYRMLVHIFYGIFFRKATAYNDFNVVLPFFITKQFVFRKQWKLMQRHTNVSTRRLIAGIPHGRQGKITSIIAV